MALNITHTLSNFQFENRENLRNTAKNILNKQGGSQESVEKIINSSILTEANTYGNAQLTILKASSQITLNNSLKETLKYLKNNANKKNTKEPVLGEIWNFFHKDKENEYNGELVDFEIDDSIKNIFAAA